MESIEQNIDIHNKKVNVTLRNLKYSDYNDIKEIMLLSYQALDDAVWERKNIKDLLKKFPEGQLCVEIDGKMVAAALSIIVDYKKFGDNHTYQHRKVFSPILIPDNQDEQKRLCHKGHRHFHHECRTSRRL
jgi:hypothetical protein